MGIKHLNTYLLKNCSNKSIQKLHFGGLENKTVVVDISIYIYKFLADGHFMEQLYLFLSIFKYYCITPIFIFDGKPPPEKWELLKKRYLEKKSAEKKYDELESLLLTDFSGNEIEKMEIMNQMEMAKKKMIRMKQTDIIVVKELMDAFGFFYIDAPHEADQLCVYFVSSGIAWACISDDMDMFLYGCPKVIRSMVLTNHSAMLYHTEDILKDLNLNLNDFLEIMVISGTDYNLLNTISLRKALEWYNEYKTDRLRENDSNLYTWLLEKTKITENPRCICDIFDIRELTKDFEQYIQMFQTSSKKMDLNKIKEIMKKDGFIFM